MAFYNFTHEEIEKVLAFINDENQDVLKTDIPQRFINAAAAFSSKLYKVYGVEKSRLASSEKTIARLRTRLEGRTVEGQFVELDFDSLDIALCIVYLLKERNSYYSRNRVQYMLYEAYSRWLADHQERLTSEHPVAQEWGPHFWHISKKCGAVQPVTTIEDFRRVSSKNPGVAEFLKNVVNKYANWREEDMKKVFTDSVPYKNAMPKPADKAVSPGDTKWGHQIKDTDIFAWKK